MTEPVHITRILNEKVLLGVSIFGRFYIKHWCIVRDEHQRPKGHDWARWSHIFMEQSKQSASTIELLTIDQDLFCPSCELRGTITDGQWQDVKRKDITKAYPSQTPTGAYNDRS